MAQSFYPSAQNVIDRALEDIGAIDPEGGVTPTTTERTSALAALNYLVTSWQAHGLQVWCQKYGQYLLANGVNNVTVGPGGTVNIARPLSIQKAWLEDPNTVDRPIMIVGRDEYNSLSTKTSTGVPTCIFYDPEYDLPAGNSGASAKGRIYLWPVPDTTIATNYNLLFVYTRPIQDFSVVGDSIDFPQEWYDAIRWNLALSLCPAYGVPAVTWDRVRAMAKEAKDLALSWDTDRASSTISPSSEGSE